MNINITCKGCEHEPANHDKYPCELCVRRTIGLPDHYKPKRDTDKPGPPE